MSRVVDDRVVQMQFENTNFERNVSQSMSTLDKLKAALSFKGVENNFDEVERSTLSLGKSFDAFESLATGVFIRLGQQATDWAEKTIKSMSGIDNAVQGFKKYTDVTKATGTLMSQGFDFSEIEKQQKRQMWFADETSYSYSDMADNLTKYTAAGFDLESATNAMMGVALVAADAGQNSAMATRAMVQFAQAASRPITWQDWQQAVMNTQMDTQRFRKALIETALEMGTLEKAADGTYHSIVEDIKAAGQESFTLETMTKTLTAGQWLTSGVLVRTLGKYTAALDDIYAYTEENGVTASEAIKALDGQIDEFGVNVFKAAQEARSWGDVVDSVKDAASTAWMSIFQTIFGNYMEAKDFFTELSERFYYIFVQPIWDLNDVLERWKSMGGRSIFIDSLLTLLAAVENVFGAVSDAYYTFFYDNEDATEKQAHSVWAATNAFKDFAYNLYHATENLDDFKRVLNGVFGIFDLIKQAAGAAIDTIFSLFGGLSPITSILGEAAAGIGDFIGNISKSSRESNFFGKAFETAFKPLFNIKATILEFVEKLTPKFSKAWGELAPQFEKLKPGIDKVKESLKGFFDLFKGYWERLFTHVDVDGTISRLGKLWTKLKNVLFQQDENGLDIFDKLNNWLTEFSGDIDSATAWVQEHVSKLWAVVKEEFNKFVDWMINNAGPAWNTFKEKATEVFDWIKLKVGPVWNMVKSGLSTAYDWIINHTDQLEKYAGQVWDFIKKLGSTVWSFLSGLYGGDVNETGDLGISKTENKLTNFMEALKKIADVIGTVFSGLWKLISPILDGIKNSFQNMSFEGLGTAAAGGGLAVVGVALANFIKSLKKSNILEGLNEILGGVGNVLDSFAHSLDAKALKEAAIGVGILVAAIFVLTTIPIDDLTAVATVLAVFVKAFIAAVQSISDATTGLKLNKGGLDFTSSNSGSTFFKMALGLVAIALALKVIASIPVDQLYSAAIVVAGLVAIIGFLIKQIAKIQQGDKNVSKNILGGNKKTSIANVDGLKIPGIILAIGVTLYLLAKAVGKMTGYIEHNMTSFAWAVIAIVGLMLTMFAVVKNLNEVEISGKLFFAWIGLAAAIWILVKALEPLIGVNFWGLLEAVGAVVVLMAAMAAVVWAVNKWGGSGKQMLAFSGSMLLLVGVIYALVGAIAILAVVMKMEKAGDAFVVLGLLIVALGYLVSQASKFKNGSDMIKFAAGLIVLSVALGLITGVLYGLAEIAAGGHLLAAGIALAAILGAIVGLAALIGRFKVIERGFQVLITLGTTIAVIMVSAAASIWLISEALKTFSDGSIDFSKAADNMMTVVDRVMDSLPGLITKLIEVAIGVLVSKVTLLSTTTLDTVLAVIEALQKDDKLQRILSGLLELLNVVLDNLLENIGPIISKLVRIAGIAIVTACEELGKWAKENRDAISTALDQLISSLFGIVLDLFDPLGEKIFGRLWDNEDNTGIKNFLEGSAKSFLAVTLIGWMTKTFVPKFVATLNPISLKVAAIIALITTAMGLVSQLASVENPTYDDPARKKRLEEYYKEHNDLSASNPQAEELMAMMPSQVARWYSANMDVVNGQLADISNILNNPMLGKTPEHNMLGDVSDSWGKKKNDSSGSDLTIYMNQTNSYQGNSTPIDTYRAANSMVNGVIRGIRQGAQ